MLIYSSIQKYTPSLPLLGMGLYVMNFKLFKTNLSYKPKGFVDYNPINNLIKPLIQSIKCEIIFHLAILYKRLTHNYQVFNLLTRDKYEFKILLDSINC